MLATDPQPTSDHRYPDQLRLHAQAGAVPDIARTEYSSFRADIAQRGLLVPLEITSEDVVLDGRQRLRAARELGLERVPVRVVEAEDELDYMLRAAILRRHISPSQRAALVVELSQYEQLRAAGERRQRANLHGSAEVAKLPPRGKTRDQAASWAGVSPRTIQDAATVHQHDPELFERVKQGQVAAAPAAQRVRRALRDQAIPPAPPMPAGPFELVYADPPWQMGNPDSGSAPENHYPTMPLAQIKALPVPAAADAVLFLWAVSSLLPEAFEVMHAWGFHCKTTLVWVKQSIGPGIWVRNRHELLLLGRKGNHPPADRPDRPDSVIEADRRAHSQKPDCVYQLLERMYPAASKAELFARSGRPGWTAWGNQAPA